MIVPYIVFKKVQELSSLVTRFIRTKTWYENDVEDWEPRLNSIRVLPVILLKGTQRRSTRATGVTFCYGVNHVNSCYGVTQNLTCR